MGLKQLLKFSILLTFSLSSFTISGQRNFNIELLAEVSHGDVLTNDVWGYTDSSGVEYGVVGTLNEAIIYELSDPRNPKEIKRIPGVNSVWRDYKSYGNYIYQTTDQGSDGLTVIDMSQAPDSITSFLWTPDIELGGASTKLRRCHNLWMDEKGYAYLAGCNVSKRGVLIIDVATDPYNPRYVSAVDEQYAHDVITQDTFLYASELNVGSLGIYSIADPLNPKLLSRTRTSSNFTHNAWPSDDGQYIYTTDERSRAFMDVYNISDPRAPERIAMYQPSPGKSVIPHNVHYYNGFLVVSWYTEGVIIIDAHRPDNLVRVGQYDTHPQNDQGGDGCWGAYPYFNSGIITAGDINKGFFVLKPTYQRAAYIEGQVLESGSFQTINNALIQILDTDNTTNLSNAKGEFKTGTADTGLIQVIVSHSDYITDTVEILLESGVVVQKSFLLKKKGRFTASGIIKSQSGVPISNATVKFKIDESIFIENTDQNGQYSIALHQGQGEFLVAAWGYKGAKETITIDDNIQKDIILDEGYEDDFFADLGWSVSGNALSGIWERATPVSTIYEGEFSNPNQDIPNDLGDMCYVTGNQGTSVGVDDVDNGTTILTSPEIILSNYENPTIAISTWFFNAGGSTPINDTMQFALLSSRDTIVTNSVIYIQNSSTSWNEPLEILIRDYISDIDTVRLQISVGDILPRSHLVEGGIDAFRIKEAGITTPTKEISENLSLVVRPNPVSDILTIDLENIDTPSKIQIIGINGLIYRMAYSNNNIDVSHLPVGVYHITLWSDNKRYNSQFVKI